MHTPGKGNGSGSKPPLNPVAMRAMVERVLSGHNPNLRFDQERAQDLAYDAMEASTWEGGFTARSYRRSERRRRG